MPPIDGVAITAGSGTTILTDDTGAGGHAQVVKLAISTDGSGTLIPADGTNGITVNLGTNNDVTVTGTVAVTQSGTWDEVGINDSGNSITVDNGGTFAVQVDGAALTSLQLIDDAVYASDAALNKTMAIGAVLDDTATVAITENQAGYLRMSSRRALLVEGVASGTAQNVLDTNSAAALTAVQKIDDPVVVDDAAFTLGTGSVMMAGNAVVAHGSNPDVADAGDAAAPLMNRHRIPFNLGGHPNLVSAEYYTNVAQTDDGLLPDISAGTIYVITGITVTCSAANATSPSVRIGFGATTVPAQGAAGATGVAKVLLSHPGIPPGSGIVKGHGGGIVGIGGDGEEPRITCTTPTTSLIVQIDYFTITS